MDDYAIFDAMKRVTMRNMIEAKGYAARHGVLTEAANLEITPDERAFMAADTPAQARQDAAMMRRHFPGPAARISTPRWRTGTRRPTPR